MLQLLKLGFKVLFTSFIFCSLLLTIFVLLYISVLALELSVIDFFLNFELGIFIIVLAAGLADFSLAILGLFFDILLKFSILRAKCSLVSGDVILSVQYSSSKLPTELLFWSFLL